MFTRVDTGSQEAYSFRRRVRPHFMEMVYGFGFPTGEKVTIQNAKLLQITATLSKESNLRYPSVYFLIDLKGFL